MGIVIVRAAYHEPDIGNFEWRIETSGSDFVLIHGMDGGGVETAVPFSTFDELRAALPSAPTSNLSAAQAQAALTLPWTGPTLVNDTVDRLIGDVPEGEDPLFAPPGAPIVGYRIRDASDFTSETPRQYSWTSFSVYATYEYAVVGLHAAGLSPGHVPDNAFYDVVPVDEYGRLITVMEPLESPWS